MPGKNIDLMPKRTVKGGDQEIILFARNLQKILKEGGNFYRDSKEPDDLQHFYILDDKEGLKKMIKDPDSIEELDEEKVARTLYEKAYNGELFIRAAGEEYPRQVTVNESGLASVSANMIRGINEVERPEFPGIWVWLFNKLSGGNIFAEEMEEYYLQMRQFEQAKSITNRIKEISDEYNLHFKEGEERWLTGVKEREEAHKKFLEEEQAKKQQELRDREEKYLESKTNQKGPALDKFGENKNAYLDVSMELHCYENLQKNLKEFFLPEYSDPKKTFFGQPQDFNLKGNLVFGEYTEGAQKGMKDSGLSDQQIAILALSACCTPRASDARRIQVSREHASGSFRSNSGHELQVELLCMFDIAQNRFDFRYLMDEVMFQENPALDTQWQKMIIAGRKITGDSMEVAFDSTPTPRHLGCLLRDGIRECITLFNSSPTLDHRAMAYGLMAGQLAKMCENYNLWDFAKHQGLKRDELTLAAGAARMAQIRYNGLRAQKQLLEAGAEGKKLENTEALLADVQLMSIMVNEHRNTYERHKNTPAFKNMQATLDQKADDNWMLVPERLRDCESLRKYGQDTTFPLANNGKLLAQKPELHNNLRAGFTAAKEIKEIAQRSPQEVADYVRNAADKDSVVYKTSRAVVDRWHREEDAEREERNRQNELQNNRTTEHISQGEQVQQVQNSLG